jgi:adenosine kinase
MGRVLICGTLAYDDIGRFAEALQPGTRNVKLEDLHRAFGGCAMNMAYNLAGLGHQPVPFVYAGDDYGGDYARHVAARGISETGIFRIPGTPSARGIVLTGSDGAQFTAFYPGPSGVHRWPGDLAGLLADGHFDAAIVAPDLPAKMAGCAQALSASALLLWCPGQYAELLSAAELAACLEARPLLVANQHEWLALTALMPAGDLLASCRGVVITAGAAPVRVLPQQVEVSVPAPPGTPLDPTGCGDAFAAALCASLLAGASLPAAVAAGCRVAGQCLICAGAQNHAVSPEAVAGYSAQPQKPRLTD